MMTTENYHLCVNIYFQDYRETKGIIDFYIFVKNFVEGLGRTISHFSCDYFGNTQIVKKEQVYRFSNQNIKKLDLILENVKFRNLFFYQSDSRDVLYDSTVIIALDDDTRYKPYRRIYIEMSHNIMSQLEKNGYQKNFFVDLFQGVDQIVDIQYGFITAMAQSKLPAIYFSDVHVSTTDKDEILNLAIWLSKRDKYDKKMRSIYWGNLLGVGHLTTINDENLFLEQLTTLLGKNNVIKFSSGKVFFSVSDMSNIDIVSEYKQRTEDLLGILDNFNLIIKSDGTEYIPGLFYQK